MAPLVISTSVRRLPPGQLTCSSVESMVNLSCMSFLKNGNTEIVVAGHQNVLFKIDVEQGCIIEEVLSTT